jgi:GntR family transcriptional regulator/MocR family aminotransferase
VPSFEQYTLAAFINRGYFERHINRMKKYYRELHSGLIDEFEKSRISGISVLSDPAAGLHFSLKLDTDLSDDRIRSEMEKNGVRVSFMSDYIDGENTAPHILLVNYSGLDREKFGKALEILYTIIS